MQKLVTIIVPCYNEQESLPHLYKALVEAVGALPRYDWELLFIDDGSHDDTPRILDSLLRQDDRVAVVTLSRNFGKEKAMLAGFDHAHGDCAILLDADLQDPPALIADMLSWWEKGYEDVYARRRDRGQESWLRRRLSLLFYQMLSRCTRYDVLKNVGDFRLLDRKCLDALRNMRETERYTKGLFSWMGYRKKEIVFDRIGRHYGHNHWNMLQLTALAIEGFTSTTTAPLRLASITGLATAFVALAYLVWTLVKVALWGDPVAGFPTLICVILFLGAVQLITIGILGEYVGRIFAETKRRPVYLVESYRHHGNDRQAQPSPDGGATAPDEEPQ